MQNRYKQKHIEMPLMIGADQVKNNHQTHMVLTSDNFSISIDLQNDKQFRSFLKSNEQESFVCNYKMVKDNNLQIRQQKFTNLLDSSIGSQNQDNKYLIYKKLSLKQSRNELFKLSFQIQISSILNQKMFDFTIKKQNLRFQLLKINSNIKFVKNATLLDLLNSKSKSNQQKGLITMDQSSRLLFMQQKMKFPVIGFWLKTQSSLNNLDSYERFSQFIKQNYEKRCIFKHDSNDKKYFYFVKVAQASKKMETFLVSWNQKPNIKKPYKFQKTSKKIDIKWNQQSLNHKEYENPQSNKNITKKVSEFSRASSKRSQSGKSEQNGMDFTLRESKGNNIQTLESLINYSYLSPIKQLEQNKQQQNLFSQDCQNSPQFSTLCKNNEPDNENYQLKTKVKEQEVEIKKLRQIISIMQSELKLYKNSRMSTNCQSSTKDKKFSPQIDSPNSFPFTASQRQNINGLSPEDLRRLRQSDLNSNSVSQSDWMKNSSHRKSNRSKSSCLSNSKEINQLKSTPLILSEEIGKENIYEQLPKIVEQDARDPWDYMQIIQD